MLNSTPRTGRRPLRGKALDQALSRELEGMVAEGAGVSPISLVSVARRLALGSRTTLYEPSRFERIRAARVLQRQSVRETKSTAQNGDCNVHSRTELQQLRKDLNELRGYVVQIAINAHRMGLQPELLLSLSERESRKGGPLNADRLALQYLSGLGLLAKLDANVRGLAR